jgi:hypothetical protein
MDIERRYRRFQDFGLVGGLSIAITELGLVLESAFKDSHYITTIRIVSILFIVGILSIGIKFATETASPLPWQPNRSRKERVIAIVIVSGIVIVEILVLAFAFKGN